MKKKIIPLLIAAAILSGCSGEDIANGIVNAAKGISDAKDAAENAVVNAINDSEPGMIKKFEDTMLDLFEKGDREGFRALFCEEVRESDGFDEQFNEFFDATVKSVPYYGDMILWYAKCDSYGGKYDSSGGLIKKTLEWVNLNYEIPRTDIRDETFWNMTYEWQREHSDPRKVGLRYFSAELLNVRTYVIGEVGA